MTLEQSISRFEKQERRRMRKKYPLAVTGVNTPFGYRVCSIVVGGQVVVRCPYCDGIHFHGVGGWPEQEKAIGWRCSHCACSRSYFVEVPTAVYNTYAEYRRSWK